MNPLLIPTIFGTIVFFLLGVWISNKALTRANFLLFLVCSLLAAIPAILFTLYYTRILGEAIWFYSFRAIPGIELTACGIGLLAGWFQTFRNRNPAIRRQMSVFFIPFIMSLCVVFPYLKQIFLKPNWADFEDRWSDGVCLQSSESSCGPASVATLLKNFGGLVSEKQIAQEAFTSRRGTENWYLIRTIRKHGFIANYSIGEENNVDLPFPAIVGVRLGGKGGTGHFIPVLGKINQDGVRYVIGDPLRGREELTEQELLARYYFTGFSIVVTTNHP